VGEVAPFPLASVDDVIGWAETIRDVVTDGRMPPWHANPSYGHFLNDARLPDGDKNLIVTWVKNGCPKGDLSQLPKLPEFIDGWRIPMPDAIYKMPEPFEVPADGVVPYQYFTLDASFPEDRWVKAAEVRPGNRAVTHHIALFFHPAGKSGVDPQESLINQVAGYGPGMPPTVYTDNTYRRIPAGAKLMLQTHYTSIGSAQTDRSEVGMLFAEPRTVKREITVAAAINPEFSIPPNVNDYAVDAVYDFAQDSVLYYLTPHMHLRGKSFQFNAVYPGGRQEILLDVPRYDFNWQNSYLMAEPKLMPEGTRIYCTATFDNSSANLANPDPKTTVKWGEQTWDEMMVGTMGVSLLEQDFSIGLPLIKQLDDGRYEVLFKYRPKEKVYWVNVTGSFDDWSRHLKMEGPDANGWYRLPVTLRAGEHQYAFLLDGNKVRLDPGNACRGGPLHFNVLHVGDGK
jgi:hypothetical protein